MKKFTIILMLALLFGTVSARNTGLVYHEVQVEDENGVTITTISSVEIYAPDTTTDAVIYSDRALQNTITIPMTTSSSNTTLSNGVFTWYGPDGYDFSVTDGTNISTNADHRTRTASDGRIGFPTYLTSISTTQYNDDETATFGTSSDWVARAGVVADRMTWTPATDSTSAFYIGSTSKTADLNVWGASADAMWDASRNMFTFKDSAFAGFGSATLGSTADFIIYHTAASSILTIAAVNADETVHFGDGSIATDVLFQNTTTAGADVHWDDSEEEWNWGADNTGVDVKFWGDGTGNYVIWDESIDTLVHVDGNVKYDDDAIIYLGTKTNVGTADGDVTIQFDSANFEIFATAASTPFDLGGTAAGFDYTYFWETAGTIFTDYTGDYRSFSDNMEIRFGTGAGVLDGDLKLSSNASNVLQLEQVVLDTGTFEIGVTDRDIPMKWWGETGADFVLFTGDLVQLEDIEIQAMDDTAITWGDNQDGQLQYDEDGLDAMQWNNVAIYGDARLIEVVTTSSNTITAAESGKIFISSYTGTQSIILPNAAAGLYFTFIDGSSAGGNDVAIDPQGADSIDFDAVGDAIESVTDAHPTSTTLCATDGINWHTIAQLGTWGAQ